MAKGDSDEEEEGSGVEAAVVCARATGNATHLPGAQDQVQLAIVRASPRPSSAARRLVPLSKAHVDGVWCGCTRRHSVAGGGGLRGPAVLRPRAASGQAALAQTANLHAVEATSSHQS